MVTFKRQRVGNKVYLRRFVTETLDQIQNASTAQAKPKIVCEVKATVFFL